MSNRQIILACLFFVLSLLGVRLLWQHSWSLLAVELTISLLALWNTKWRFVRTYLFVAIMGPLAEIVCIDVGAWRYAGETFLGVPVWLPPLWGIAGLCFITTGIFFREMRVR
jgi:hypothetical protein